MSRIKVLIGIAVAVVAAGALTLAQGGGSLGPLAVWGTDLFASGAPPTYDFTSLASGGAQSLAIKADGTLYLSSGDGVPNPIAPITSIVPSVVDLPFSAVGMGRSHGLAIRPDGSILGWPAGSSALKGGPPTGQFVAVTGNAGASVALDRDGNVVVWGAGATPAPAGMKFTAIAARINYIVAVGVDGNVYGWGSDPVVFTSATNPWTLVGPLGSGQYMAPREPGMPYTAVAAGLGAKGNGLIVALRADGRVVVWDPAGSTGPAPSGVVFQQPEPFPSSRATIAAGLEYAAGIDQAGHLHSWGKNAMIAGVPAGIYTEVAAATGHLAAIKVPNPQLTGLGPATVWLGLKNSDDVGTRFDLLAEVLKDGAVVGTGQLAGVPGGSSGFNNAVARTIALSLGQPVPLTTGDTMSLRLSVRIAADGVGHRSGTARLYFNDAAASTGLQGTIGGATAPYYAVAPTTALDLSNIIGSGPKKTIDVFVDRAVGGNPFKPFGTWTIVLP